MALVRQHCLSTIALPPRLCPLPADFSQPLPFRIPPGHRSLSLVILVIFSDQVSRMYDMMQEVSKTILNYQKSLTGSKDIIYVQDA